MAAVVKFLASRVLCKKQNVILLQVLLGLQIVHLVECYLIAVFPVLHISCKITVFTQICSSDLLHIEDDYSMPQKGGLTGD